MSVAGQSQFGKHRSPRILPNEVQETPSILVRRVRKDVLFDERHALLPRPVPKLGPAGIDDRTAPLEIRLTIQHANRLRGGRQHLTAEAPHQA